MGTGNLVVDDMMIHTAIFSVSDYYNLVASYTHTDVSINDLKTIPTFFCVDI